MDENVFEGGWLPGVVVTPKKENKAGLIIGLGLVSILLYQALKK